MSVPFSNTHLRVPRGFGTILEGLTREVLRDQPEDIPTYAALYFDALLKKREESGMDPAEWAAKLEDRFYNNHAFKNSVTSPNRETTPDMNISKEKSFESQTEDESSHSAEIAALSTTKPCVSEPADSTESTDEDEENDISEKSIVSTETGLSERESVADIQNNEVSSAEEEKDPAISTFDHTDRPDKETVSNPTLEQSIARSDSQPAGSLSVEGTADVDVCAQELGVAEDEGGDHQGSISVDDSEKEKDTEVAEPVEIFSPSGLADVNVCATELGGTARALEGETVQDDSHVVEEEERLKPQVGETVAESLLPESEITEGGQEEANDQSQKTKEKEIIESEVSCGETNESLAHIEGDLADNITPKEDSLVEISFEDVPEAQRITPAGEKQPEEETSIDAIQTNMLEMQQMEEFKALTTSSTDQNVSHVEDSLEPELEIVKEECNSEGEEIESQHAAFDMMMKTVDTNNSNLNDSDVGEEEKGVKSISLSDQPTTEAEREIQEEETSSKSVDIDEIHKDESNQNQDTEKETHSNDPGFTDETAGTGAGDEEEICAEGCSEMGEREINDDKMECDPSKQTQSDTSTAGVEGESETFEESAQQLPREIEESQETLLESPKDNGEEKEVMPQEAEGHTYEATDCEIQEKTKAMGNEETISPTHSADWKAADHQEEERPAESEDTTELASKSDEEECSRPQEEEDIMDIPLDDPEANRAAAKIQAGFRGHMTRKKMKPEDKSEGEEVSSTGDVLNGSQGVSETGRSGAVERDDTSVPEQ